VTTDEELTLLEQQLRRLKIEYEMYFNNPAKRPPTDVEWKVLAILRKFSDGGRMGFAQRFRYNALAQQYAVQSDLWRKKSRIREEGYRRPQDALLGVQGVRIFEDKPAAPAAEDTPEAKEAAASHEITHLEIEEESDTLEAAAAAAVAVVDKPMAPWPGAAAKPGETKAVAPARQAAKAAAAPAAKAKPAAPHATSRKTLSIESLQALIGNRRRAPGWAMRPASLLSLCSSKETDQMAVHLRAGVFGRAGSGRVHPHRLVQRNVGATAAWVPGAYHRGKPPCPDCPAASGPNRNNLLASGLLFGLSRVGE
jgi:hypothetical protein